MSKKTRRAYGFSSKNSKPKEANPKKATDRQTSQEKLALGLIHQGSLREAEAIYREQLKLGKLSHISYCNLAAICGRTGRPKERLKFLSKALEIEPNHAEAQHNLGIAKKEMGNINEAIISLKKAIEINPGVPLFHNSLGVCLNEIDSHEEAILAFQKALLINPDYSECYNNLGISFKETGNNIEAIRAYKNALRVKPDYYIAQNNLGVVIREEGDLDQAIFFFNSAIKINPQYLDAHTNLSHALLLNGDYKKGLEAYEIRSENPKNASKPHAKIRSNRWNGDSLNPLKDLIIVSEQGLGDTLQFMRYVIVLQEKGIEVTFCAQPKLHELIKVSGIHKSPISPPEAESISDQEWIPLLSLLRHLEVNPQNPIIYDPYIKTEDKLIQNWKNLLIKEKRPIIGINWQGNPHVEKKGFRGRSLALEEFSEITNQMSQIRLLSLQKGYGSEQLNECSFQDRFVECQDKINKTWDFLNTAAIIQNCDLIITSDTAVAHLAGGMGKKTWLLLNYLPDWRWGIKGEKTFWYPSLRLFRQKERGDWKAVIKTIAEELISELSSKSNFDRVE